MSEYTIKTAQGLVIRNLDGKVVAPCQSAEDPDFIAYCAWASLLDTEGKLVNIPIIDQTIPVTEQDVISTVQNLLDTTAQSKRYDNMLSLSTYVNSTVPKFKAEAETGIAWRDGCWSTCYDILASDIEITSIDEVLSQLPSIVWP